MSEIVRIWLYKTTEDLPYSDCKISKINQPTRRVVRGDFEYYKVEGETALRVNRYFADQWSDKMGRKVETILGYPVWMHDQGYRA